MCQPEYGVLYHAPLTFSISLFNIAALNQSLYIRLVYLYIFSMQTRQHKKYLPNISVSISYRHQRKVYHIHIVKTHSNLQPYIYFYIFVSCIISSYTLWNCHQFLSSICHKSHELPLRFMLISNLLMSYFTLPIRQSLVILLYLYNITL